MMDNGDSNNEFCPHCAQPVSATDITVGGDRWHLWCYNDFLRRAIKPIEPSLPVEISRVMFTMTVGVDTWEKEIEVPFVPSPRMEFEGIGGDVSRPDRIWFDPHENKWVVDLRVRDTDVPEDREANAMFADQMIEKGWYRFLPGIE